MKNNVLAIICVIIIIQIIVNLSIKKQYKNSLKEINTLKERIENQSHYIDEINENVLVPLGIGNPNHHKNDLPCGGAIEVNNKN